MSCWGFSKNWQKSGHCQVLYASQSKCHFEWSKLHVPHSYLPDKLKIPEPKIIMPNSWSHPRVLARKICFSCDGRVIWTCWEKEGVCWCPPTPCLPTSLPQFKEEIIQWLSLWFYNHVCAKRTREYSDFLIMFIFFLGSCCVWKGSIAF